MYEVKYKISIEDEGKTRRVTKTMAVENAIGLHDAVVAAMARLAEIETETRTATADFTDDGATVTMELKTGAEPDTEIVSARLTNIRETHSAEKGGWYEVTVKETPAADEKPMKYAMLFMAESLDDCMARARRALEQGYDMTTVAARESPVDEVVDAAKYHAEMVRP